MAYAARAAHRQIGQGQPGRMASVRSGARRGADDRCLSSAHRARDRQATKNDGLPHSYLLSSYFLDTAPAARGIMDAWVPLRSFPLKSTCPHPTIRTAITWMGNWRIVTWARKAMPKRRAN